MHQLNENKCYKKRYPPNNVVVGLKRKRAEEKKIFFFNVAIVKGHFKRWMNMVYLMHNIEF